MLLCQLREDAKANDIFGWKLWFSPFTSPAMLTLILYRVSASLVARSDGFRALSKLLHRLSIILTGCHISPLSRVGAGLRLPHPVGIVIGEGVDIGENVTLYQNTTLGVSDPDARDYPVVEDCVTVFAGAVVAGGVKLGNSSVIGANAFVHRDVPPGATAVGVPARIISP